MSMNEKYMQRCFALANLGLGKALSNPMVGAVLVYENQIIGEGYHQEYGQAHAEVNCINNVKEAFTNLIAEATLYINLEPCFHFGKTPPCVDLILQKGIRKVVIAMEDPNPLVAGKSIEKLRAAGVEVITDVCKQEAMELNKRFICFHQKKRPYVILKYAVSKEGYFCRKDKQPQWLSSADTNRLVHQWRSDEMAILVGKNTVLIDHPLLTVRHIDGQNPIRIILDSHLNLNLDEKVFNSDVQVIIANQLKEETVNHLQYIQVNSIDNLLEKLQKFYISSILVEGGITTIEAFLKTNKVDEIRFIQTDTSIVDGINAPYFEFEIEEILQVATDKIYIYRNKKSI